MNIKNLEQCSSSTNAVEARKYLVATAIWGGSFLLANFAVKHEWVSAGWPAGIMVAVPALLGIWAGWRYRKYIQSADELRQKIEMDALAFALGVGVIGGLCYWLLEVAGIIAEAELIWVIAAMMIAQGVGSLVGLRKYS